MGYEDPEPPKESLFESALGKGIAIVIFLAFGLPGIGLSFYLYRMNQAVEAQANWAQVEVFDVKLPEETRRNFPHDDVTYTYRFEGTAYDGQGTGGTRIKVNDADRELDQWVRTTRDRIRQKAVIPGWVDPQDPSHSALIRKSPSVIAYFIGLFTFSHGLVGIGLLLFAFLGGTGRRRPMRVLQFFGFLFWSNAFLWPSLQMLNHVPGETERAWVSTPAPFLPWLMIGLSVLLLGGFILWTLRGGRGTRG